MLSLARKGLNYYLRQDELLSTAGIERAMAELDAYYAENGISSTAQEAYVAIVDKYSRLTMITDVNSSESGLMTTSDGRISLNMTLILQENDYYCGPATVKSVVSKITGSSNTQSYYASLLGTTDAGTVMENIDDVLNRFSGTHTYTMDEIPNQYLWGLQM